MHKYKPAKRGELESKREEVSKKTEAYVIALADKATTEWTSAKELLGDQATPPMILGGPMDRSSEVFEQHGLEFKWKKDGLEVRKAGVAPEEPMAETA